MNYFPSAVNRQTGIANWAWYHLKYVIYFLFFLPYTGTSLPAYFILLLYFLALFIVRPDSFKFTKHDVLIVLLLLCWVTLKLWQSPLEVTFVLFRYYFGFYFFYLFFRQSKFEMNLEVLLLVISIFVIAEAILINTVLSPSILPNYPISLYDGVATYQTNILGFYQRPYSIGNNASVTGTILMILLFYLRTLKFQKGLQIKKIITIAAYLAVILTASGEGYVLLILYNIYLLRPFKNLYRILLCAVAVFAVYLLIFVFDVGMRSGLERISREYFYFLYNFKIGQINDVIFQLKKTGGVLMGFKFNDVTKIVVFSDFAWNDLFLCTGVIGLFSILFILVPKLNRCNYVVIVIFIIAAFHYGAIYSLPGQILTGYFLSQPLVRT